MGRQGERGKEALPQKSLPLHDCRHIRHHTEMSSQVHHEVFQVTASGTRLTGRRSLSSAVVAAAV